MGFDVVLRHAFTGVVHDSEGELRLGVALLRGLAEPGDGFGVILWDALALGVKLPEGGLRLGNASLGEGAQVGEFLC